MPLFTTVETPQADPRGPVAELMRAVVQVANANFHTVAQITASSASDSLPYVSEYDIEDGCARVAGAENGFVSTNLPALLIHNDALGSGVIICIWHRDESSQSDDYGARVSVRTQQFAISCFTETIHKLENLNLDFQLTSGLKYNYENAYQSFSVYASFVWAACGPKTSGDYPTNVPNIY